MPNSDKQINDAWDRSIRGVIVLPFPPKELFPNFKRRHHWSKYRPKEKKAREDGYWAAHKARPALPDDRSIIPLRITFYPPDRRARDDDGMIGAIKNYRDGVADALGVDDKVFRCLYVVAEPDRPGRVEIEVFA